MNGNNSKRQLVPKAVLLDVNGTLFPAQAAIPAFHQLELAPADQLVELWFAAVLRDAFAGELAGVFKPFKDYGAHHLECMLRAAGKTNTDGQDGMQQVMQAWQGANLHPDVITGLQTMHAKGIKVAVMTNGSAEAIAKPALDKAGLSDIVSPLLDISMAQAYKPHPKAYRFALRSLRLRPHEVMMVASHPWDIHGAKRVGLQAAYVQRCSQEAYPACWELQPDCVVSSFDELAAVLTQSS